MKQSNLLMIGATLVAMFVMLLIGETLTQQRLPKFENTTIVSVGAACTAGKATRTEHSNSACSIITEVACTSKTKTLTNQTGTATDGSGMTWTTNIPGVADGCVVSNGNNTGSCSTKKSSFTLGAEEGPLTIENTGLCGTYTKFTCTGDALTTGTRTIVKDGITFSFSYTEKVCNIGTAFPSTSCGNNFNVQGKDAC